MTRLVYFIARRPGGRDLGAGRNDVEWCVGGPAAAAWAHDAAARPLRCADRCTADLAMRACVLCSKWRAFSLCLGESVFESESLSQSLPFEPQISY